MFETSEEAARAYDQAAILMSGKNAKTNFPITQTLYGEPKPFDDSPPSPKGLSEKLHAKLRKNCAAQHSDSNWVMTVKLWKNESHVDDRGDSTSALPEHDETVFATEQNREVRASGQGAENRAFRIQLRE